MLQLKDLHVLFCENRSNSHNVNLWTLLDKMCLTESANAMIFHLQWDSRPFVHFTNNKDNEGSGVVFVVSIMTVLFTEELKLDKMVQQQSMDIMSSHSRQFHHIPPNIWVQ